MTDVCIRLCLLIIPLSPFCSTEHEIDVSRAVIKTDSKSKSPRKKPLPDFSRLKADQAMNEEKVVEFLKASCKLPTSVEIVETEAGNDAEIKKERIVLPPTDRLSQLSIRYSVRSVSFLNSNL